MGNGDGHCALSLPDFDNPFSHILAGSIGFITKAGLLGGGVTLLGMLGLTGGALLP
jgi:hypothetical protein